MFLTLETLTAFPSSMRGEYRKLLAASSDGLIKNAWQSLSASGFSTKPCVFTVYCTVQVPCTPLSKARCGYTGAELNSKIQLNELGWRESFLDQLYDYLKKNIQSKLYLDDVAEAFGMSAASFKRKLQKHDTHFQAQLDLARKHVALYLFQVKGY